MRLQESCGGYKSRLVACEEVEREEAGVCALRVVRVVEPQLLGIAHLEFETQSQHTRSSDLLLLFAVLLRIAEQSLERR